MNFSSSSSVINSTTNNETTTTERDTEFPFDTHLIDNPSFVHQENHRFFPSTITSAASLDLQYLFHHPHLHQLQLQDQTTFMGDSPDSPREIYPNIFSNSSAQGEGLNNPHQYEYDILSNSHGNITNFQDHNKYTTAANNNVISESSSSNLSYTQLLPNQDVPLTLREKSILSRKISQLNRSTSNNNITSNYTSLDNNSTTPLKGKKSKRRKHKNSKLGCATCKERRVKCSEDLPSCTNCIKHKVKCPYLDYTEEQLNELKQAQYLQQQPTDSEDELQVQQEPQPESQSQSQLNPPLLSQKKVIKPKVKRSKLTGSKTQLHSVSSSASLSSSFSTTNTQNFENLLSHRNEDNSSIVYPVPSYNLREVSTNPVPKSNEDNENPTLQNAFVGALHLPTTFNYKVRKKIDYAIELKRSLKIIAPSIGKGTSALPEIRNLYSSWLNSFIFKAYTSELMFYCLLNLTTNFLISNCFKESRNRLSTDELAPNSSNYYLAHIRLQCTAHSFRYYALVIKDLREFLNDNSDPDLCGSVSYILSLMSIYDPEATLVSTICFRNGLFCIFNHNFKVMKKKAVPLVDASTTNPQDIPLLPAHQKLMTNIALSVFLPEYDPSFLGEYQQLLVRFGDLVFPLLHHYRSTSTMNAKPNYDFLQIHYHDLLNFTENLKFYIPQLTNTLSDLDSQKALLFQMLFSWVRMFPSRLIITNKSDSPLVKMLHLFYKLMKKSLFAIFPQVKYFFLRDFDSPLMLDVFATNINGIFEELDDLDSTTSDTNYDNRLPPELYVPLINELKSMSSYLIRGINYFERRLSKLYRLLVTHSEDLHFNDNNIKDIAECRDRFKSLIGLREVCITSFIHQNIRYENYPTVDGEDNPHQESNDMDNDTNDGVAMLEDRNVDFMTLQFNGLLVNDYDPRNSV